MNQNLPDKQNQLTSKMLYTSIVPLFLLEENIFILKKWGMSNSALPRGAIRI